MKITFIAILVFLLVSCGFKKSEEHYFLKAEECYTNKQYEKSIKYIEKAIAIYSENDINFFALAKVNKEIGKYDNAMQAINKAIQLNPIHEYYYEKSTIYGRMRDFENALIFVEKAVDLSDLDLYKESRASYYMHTDQYDNAISEFNKLYDKGHHFNEFSLRNYVNLLIDEELYDKAMDVTNMALESDSLNLFFLHKKGVIYFGMDEYDDSIKTFQIVLNNSVDEINLLEDCLFFIAESNFLLGNYETSIRSFTELIKVMLHDKELLLKEKIYQNTSEFFKSLLYNYTRLIIIIDKLEEYRKLRETLETIISIIQDNNIETIIDYPIIIVYYLVPINDYKLNESDTAILNYRKAVQLDTEYKGDLDKLAEVWFLEDNIDILREIAKMADK